MHFYVTFFVRWNTDLPKRKKLFFKLRVYKELPKDNLTNKGDSCIFLLHP